MSFYPQTGRGVVTQFPFSRSRTWRAITNQLESGERISLPDTAGGQILWNLSYEDLSDTELTAIRSLHSACQGGFAPFTFVDPMANLLGWSETLNNNSWQSTELAVSAGALDPLGSQRAWTVVNSTPGQLALSQTLGVSGDYVACMSAYVKASGGGSLTLQRDSTSRTVPTGTNWSRVYISCAGNPGEGQSTFSVLLSPGQTVEVFGLQVEAQPFPSTYKPTSTATGIYEETYFADDELTTTRTGPGLSRGLVNLISRI